ncbi:MAG: thioredoxin family protein [Thermoleophilia bacterium]|nr:thioredoxin family protein [Thermoleophilia bacterium]
MRTQIRLRLFLPLLAVALGGLAAFQLGLLDRVGLGPGQAETVAASAAGGAEGDPSSDPVTTGSPTPATGEAAPAGTEAAEPTEEAAPTEAGATEDGTAGQSTGTSSGGMAELESALERHKVVVLVVYTPGSSVDSLVAQEGRLAAEDVGVGFVSVNAAKEKQIGELALEYDLRLTPTVLVFRRGPTVVNRFTGYLDRTAIAQAAATAKRPA